MDLQALLLKNNHITLMAQIYEVKREDTLSAIARKLGIPINQITGYRSGDPDLIYPGEKLTIGEPASELGGLGGTLKTGGGVDVSRAKELPTFQADKLSTFKNLLKSVSERYTRESMATGLPSAMGTLGVSPEQISGRNLAGIVDFIKGQVTPSISDIYKSTIDLLESSRTSAEKQLNILISQNALTRLTDEQLAKLSNMSGMDFEYLAGIKQSQEAEEKKPKSFQIIERGGRKVRLGFDAMGNIVSETDIGPAFEEARWEKATFKQRADTLAWLRKQPGYTKEDEEKLKTDLSFFYWVLGQIKTKEGAPWEYGPGG